MYYNNNSWTMLRYACYEPLHVPHLSLFILELHPFSFFSSQMRQTFMFKVYWKWELLQKLHEKGIPSIFPPHYFEKEVLFCEALFSSVIHSFCLRLSRCQRRVWRYSFCYKCGLLSYDVLTAMVLTFAHFSNEWH